MKDDLHTLSGAYALDALPYEEQGLFEEHLARCESCAVEIRGLRETTARLGLAVAERPPAAMKARVMAEIAQVRQDPPLIEEPPALDFSASGSFAQGSAASDPPTNVVRLVPRRRRPRAALIVAAVSTAAATVLGVVTINAVRERDAAVEQSLAVENVLAAPDAVAKRVQIAGGGSATIVASASRGRLMFASSGLRALDETKTYQMWLIGADGARSAGLLDGSGTRTAVVAMPGGAERFGLTVEPVGGSDQPTTTPIVLTKLPRA
jgi:hypothetical protein